MKEEEIKKLLKHESEAILNIPISDTYEKVISAIIHHVKNLNGKLITSGMGKAGQIANNIATTFCSTGSPAVFLHPSEAQHGDLGVIQNNDILLVISNSGKTREIIELRELAKNLVPEIPFILITGNPESELSAKADYCLFTGNPKEVCTLGLTPTTSTTGMTVIGDILVVGVMKAINFSSEDYAKRHHGGYLGDKSRDMTKKK